jgi:predicted phosphodiesterase
MRFEYASDLHLEFERNRTFMRDMLKEPTGDVLLLAGDIGYLNDYRLLYDFYFDYISKNYKQVIIVPGNHEFYFGSDVTQYGLSYEIEIKENVKYYHNKVIHINDEIDIIASTLWSNILESQTLSVTNMLNDFNQIYHGDRMLDVHAYNEMHIECVRFIREALKSSKAKKIIILTHHAPSLMTIAPQHMDSPINSAFSNDLDWIMKEDDRIKYWVYGHTHTNIDCQVNSTKIVCNQLGYVGSGEENKFRPGMSFSI